MLHKTDLVISLLTILSLEIGYFCCLLVYKNFRTSYTSFICLTLENIRHGSWSSVVAEFIYLCTKLCGIEVSFIVSAFFPFVERLDFFLSSTAMFPLCTTNLTSKHRKQYLLKIHSE